MSTMVCKRVVYTGRVQGVGFRYTAQRLALELPVTGFVRNRSDGSVELVAEGEEAAVASLLRAIELQMGGLIADAATEELPQQGHAGFTIRH